MKQNIQYTLRSRKENKASNVPSLADSNLSTEVSHNEESFHGEIIFTLMLKPHVIQQIIDSRDVNSTDASIEFLSDTEAILWINDDIHYKMNISSLSNNRISKNSSSVNTSCVIADENQNEIYRLSDMSTNTTTDDINSKTCLDYEGIVTHRLTVLQYIGSNATTVSSTNSNTNNNSPRYHSSAILEDINHIKLKESLATALPVSSSSSRSKSKSTSVNTTQLKSLQPSVNIKNSANDSSSFCYMLVLRHLSWDVTDTAIQQFFSPLPIRTIYSCISSSLPHSSHIYFDKTNEIYLDFYLTFHSGDEKNIAYLRNGETIKFYNKINSNNSITLVSALAKVQIEEINISESLWACCVGALWTSDSNHYYSYINQTDNKSHKKKLTEQQILILEEIERCQQPYELISSILSCDLYSDNLGLIFNQSPKQLAEIYNNINYDDIQSSVLHRSSNKSNHINNKRKQSSIHVDGNKFRCKYIPESSFQKSSAVHSIKSLESYWQEQLQYAGSNLFDKNNIFSNQYSYNFNIFENSTNNSMNKSTTDLSSDTNNLIFRIRSSLETAFILLNKTQSSIIDYVSFTNSSSQSLTNDTNEKVYESYCDDLIVFEQMSRSIDLLYSVYRYLQ